MTKLSTVKNYFSKYLPWLHTLPAERRNEVLLELEQASSPGFDYFLLVILSCSIATFGLITDSAAVIIGAMLVAPLMSPILGLSLASVAGQQRMFKRAVVALFEGVLLAAVLSAFLGWLAQVLPFGMLSNLPGEVLARTHPTPFDLGIALAGGAAAAYALAQPRLSAALPGVAIATALMPPVCTVGLGISLGDPIVIWGAALLFLTNLASISFAGIVVFFVLGFRPVHLENTWHRVPRSLLVSALLMLVTAIPLVVLTMRVVNQAGALQKVRSAVVAEFSALPDAQLVDVGIDSSNSTLHLTITVRTSRQPGYEEIVALQQAVAARLQRTIAIQVIVVPTTKLDPLVPPTFTPTFTPGPSPSPTITPTPTQVPTQTTTATPILTATPTFTPTATFTPTPTLVYIHTPGGSGTYLRETPGGRIVIWLPENTPMLMLATRETVNGREWIEVRNMLNQIGWVPAAYLIIRP